MSDSASPPGTGNGESDSTSSTSSAQSETIKTYITKDLAATTLFSMRLVTIVGTLLFLLGSLGIFPYGHSAYLNAMITAFFTFSIRLHQRKQEKQVYTFSKDMLSLFVSEDSGHYMLYTFFYYQQIPTSIYLIPPFLYAVMFSVRYTTGLAMFLPQSVTGMLLNMNQKIAASQMELRRFIAYTEIFLMVFVIWNAFSGYMFILAPLIHYQFLKLRYSSTRNGSVRFAFYELRVGAEYLSRHPNCPSIISTILVKGVTFVSSLAPPQVMRREA